MPDESKPLLAYQVGGQQVTRGQFRVLLLLIFLHLVITIQTTYVPGVMGWVNQRWAEHQARIARQKQVRQTQATTAQWLASARAASLVVWDEDATSAAKLLAGSGYGAIDAGGEPAFLRPYLSTGARARLPALIPDWLDSMLRSSGQRVVVFVHGRRVGGGPERLVAVVVGGSLQVAGGVRQPSESFAFQVYKLDSFAAQSFAINAEGAATYDLPATDLSIGDDPSGVEMTGNWTASKDHSQPGTLSYKPTERLRVFAGQADPNDESHFTIAYELDGVAGTIDGWLRADGSVILEPRAGKRVNSVWFPFGK